jgi:hypothetical protein
MPIEQIAKTILLWNMPSAGQLRLFRCPFGNFSLSKFLTGISPGKAACSHHIPY